MWCESQAEGPGPTCHWTAKFFLGGGGIAETATLSLHFLCTNLYRHIWHQRRDLAELHEFGVCWLQLVGDDASIGASNAYISFNSYFFYFFQGAQ